MAPLTPESQHISVDLASSPITRVSGTDLEKPEMSAKARARLSTTVRSNFSPVESKPALPPSGGNNTTLQSMTRPDVTGDGVTNVRRFLSIERELEETAASTKLLEKRVKALETQLKLTFLLAGCALVGVAVALTL